MKQTNTGLISSMAQSRLHNYLRTYRRKHGLSQKELATLLGAKAAGKISQYENFSRMPAVITVFALEIVFRVPASELFAGTYDSVRHAVSNRAARLLKDLAKDSSARMTRKADVLRCLIEAQQEESNRHHRHA